MLFNQKVSEGLALVDTYDPASVAASTITTPSWIPVANHHRFMVKITTGVLGASATVDAKVRQAQDSSGTGAKDITNKAITQIVKATGDNKQAFINFMSDDLDQANAFGFVQVSLTVGTAASIVGIDLYALSRFEPADQFNKASVVQIV